MSAQGRMPHAAHVAEARTAPVQDYLDGVTLADLTAEAQSADHYVI